MAIAYGALTSTVSLATSLTLTSPVVSGSNTVGLVYVVNDAGTVTSTTWNSFAMTLITSYSAPSGEKGYLYYVTNPASSTSVSVTNTNFATIVAWAFYYTGASQSGIPDAVATNTASAVTSISQAVTVVAQNSWLIACGGSYPGATVTATNSTATLRSSTSNNGVADSNGTVATGSRTGGLSLSAVCSPGIIVASLAPAVPQVGGASFLLNFV